MQSNRKGPLNKRRSTSETVSQRRKDRKTPVIRSLVLRSFFDSPNRMIRSDDIDLVKRGILLMPKRFNLSSRSSTFHIIVAVRYCWVWPRGNPIILASTLLLVIDSLLHTRWLHHHHRKRVHCSRLEQVRLSKPKRISSVLKFNIYRRGGGVTSDTTTSVSEYRKHST